jgi:hypothetical protein
MQPTPAIKGANVVSGMPASRINPNKARPMPTHNGSKTIAVKNLTLLDTIFNEPEMCARIEPKQCDREVNGFTLPALP